MSRTRSPRAGRNEGSEVAGPRPGWDSLPPGIRRISIGQPNGWTGSCGGWGVTPVKVAIVLPDAMHDNGELAGDRHLGAAPADPPG